MWRTFFPRTGTTSPTRWTFSHDPLTIMYIQGSFTTDGFAEGVTWLVLTNPISVSSATLSRCKLFNLRFSSLTHLCWPGCSSCATAAPPAPGWPTTAGATSARLLAKCETYLCQERRQPWIKERVESGNSCRVASTLPQNLPSIHDNI